MTTLKPSKAPSHWLPTTDQIPVFNHLMLFSLLFEDLALDFSPVIHSLLSTTGQWSAIQCPVLFRWLFQLLLMTTSKQSKAPIRYIVDNDSDPCVRSPRVILLAFKDLALGSHLWSKADSYPHQIFCQRRIRSLYSSAPCYSPCFLKLAHWDLTCC